MSLEHFPESAVSSGRYIAVSGKMLFESLNEQEQRSGWLFGHGICDTILVAMALAIIGMRLLEIVFFTGVAGSAIVVILSFIEDFHELFEE